MESDILLFEFLPSLLGILVLLYFASVTIRTRENFFKVVTGWVLASMAVVIAVYWVLYLMDSITEDFDIFVNPVAAFTFSVAASWFSVFAVQMTTRGGRYNDRKIFPAWIRQHPFNMVTVWGAIGLAVIVAGLGTDLDESRLLEDELPLVIIALAYIVASAAFNLANFEMWFSRSRMPGLPRETLEANLLFVVAWTGIPISEFVLGLLAGSGGDFVKYNPNVWILTLLFAVLVRAVVATQFMAITVESEMETVRREGFRVFDIPRGVYLLHDEKADPAFALFSELVSLPLTPAAEIPGKEESATATLEFLIPRGLVITREFPDKVRERHKLAVTPIIWLTETPGELRVAPTSLAVLTDTIIRFMESNPNSIVLVEGIEYIMTFNEFRKVLRSLDSLNETAWITKGRLLITVNPKAFDERELALLERDRLVVKGRAGIEELKQESVISRGAG